jgi:hypothetical protein
MPLSMQGGSWVHTSSCDGDLVHEILHHFDDRSCASCWRTQILDCLPLWFDLYCLLSPSSFLKTRHYNSSWSFVYIVMRTIATTKYQHYEHLCYILCTVLVPWQFMCQLFQQLVGLIDTQDLYRIGKQKIQNPKLCNQLFSVSWFLLFVVDLRCIAIWGSMNFSEAPCELQ